MSFLAVIFAVALFGAPVWLISRAWSMYLSLDRPSVAHLGQIQAGLASISLSTAFWLAVFLTMILEDHSAQARSIGQHLSPFVVGVSNLVLCLGGVACAGFGWATAGETARLRKAMVVSSGCLILIWLFILINPH